MFGEDEDDVDVFLRMPPPPPLPPPPPVGDEGDCAEDDWEPKRREIVAFGDKLSDIFRAKRHFGLL